LSKKGLFDFLTYSNILMYSPGCSSLYVILFIIYLFISLSLSRFAFKNL